MCPGAAELRATSLPLLPATLGLQATALISTEHCTGVRKLLLPPAVWPWGRLLSSLGVSLICNMKGLDQLHTPILEVFERSLGEEQPTASPGVFRRLLKGHLYFTS